MRVTKRAVAVIRVSHVGKRKSEPEKFISPEDQLKLINQMCAEHGWEITQIYREMDQSGLRTKFEKRRGLYPATRMIENGEAEVVAMAFFDRMARNIVVQTEFLGRIGRAGGEVWAHDWGRIATDTAAAFLASGMMGLFAMYTALSIAEKTQGPKERAIERGIPTFPHIPPGYRKSDDKRTLTVFEPEAKIIRELFEKRAAGASYHTLQAWLRSKDLPRSIHGIQELLRNRIYLGELKFGRPRKDGGSGVLLNAHAHQPIVSRARFDEVNRMHVLRGPRGDAESVYTRLLSRQGILRCEACDRAMNVQAMRVKGRRYVTYRCPRAGDCPRQAVIMADNVDAFVADYMKQVKEQAGYSPSDQLAHAQAELAQARVEYRQVMRNLATSQDDDARAVIEEYRLKVEHAQERVDQLQRAFGASAIRSMADWDTLSLAGRRDLVRAVIKRITVKRGARGAATAERVTIEPFLE